VPWKIRDAAGPLHNQLLGALPIEIINRLEPHLFIAKFDAGDVICEAGGHVQYVYFPEGCVLSLHTVFENGYAIETANIGREGAFGLMSAMFSRSSFNRCIMQLQGQLVACKVEYIYNEFKNNQNVQNLFISYSETLLSQVMQSVGCNALHTVQQRLSRWLLAMFDRYNNEDISYTHEFISNILGANRKSITIAAQALQELGCISYQRGIIKVSDHTRLENLSCECYEIVKSRFELFLRPPETSVQDTLHSIGNRIN
jgi:CRP-like cAMP-binding protein